MIDISGVGKTSAVHLICYNKPLVSPSWTVGVSLEVKLHDFKAGTPQQKTYFIDLWDVGGSSSHRNSRSVFYNGVNGVILVHDLTNRKSEANLRKWLKEIFTSRERESNSHGLGLASPSVTSSTSSLLRDDDDDFDPEQFVGSTQIPVFVIGTKQDSLSDSNRLPTHSRASLIAEECGAEEIFMVSFFGQLKYTKMRQQITDQSTPVIYFDFVLELFGYQVVISWLNHCR